MTKRSISKLSQNRAPPNIQIDFFFVIPSQM
jgi:hypothetical protein